MNENCSDCIADTGHGARRADRLGVYAVDHFTLEAPDPAIAIPFLDACGLTPSLEGRSVKVTTGRTDHVWAKIVPGIHKRLSGLSFAAYAADIDALRNRAMKAGVEIIAIAPDRFALIGPDGIEIEVVARDRSIFDVGDQMSELASDVALHRSTAVEPKALKLSHIAIFTGNIEEALEFYTGILGLRLADRSGHGLCFLHAPHGSDHHVLALVQSSGPGVHHYSWEMGSIDALGLRATIAAEKGFSKGWGFGRHVLGSNYFQYVRDPWGSHLELTAGIEYIPADIDWVAGDHPPEDAFYLWGPPPPEGFIDNLEVSQSEPALA